MYAGRIGERDRLTNGCDRRILESGMLVVRDLDDVAGDRCEWRKGFA